jgi:2-amino-4-hydroxy-6-hydroxymethyldihydropteridine diphosphokinase
MPTPAERRPEQGTKALLALGSNLAPREAWLDLGTTVLVEAGAGLLGSSPRWHTSAVGAPPQQDFLNQVLLLRDLRSGPQWLALAHTAEGRAGRRRSVPHGPRTLDVDVILIAGESWESEELTVPHPGLLTRPYLLRAAADLVPDWSHPALGTSMRELARQLLTGSWALR